MYSGTIYLVETGGTGGYVGTPSGIGVGMYAGTTSVHNIPMSKNPYEVADLLGGNNIDMSVELGTDAGTILEVTGVKGVSLDLDSQGEYQTTSAGQMYAIENSIEAGVSAAPTVLDIGFEGGGSQSSAFIYYQIPWWPTW